ncbi:ATP-binding protein [Streptomyces sp. NPDC048484]|uniref:ATP-binding protein n=1 Tax=Streptomyces sp. NPDC048484 TaxID=3155146 RepID=UPI00343A077A
MIGLPLPTSERARLTALYGGLLLAAGLLLVTVIYLMTQNGLDALIDGAFTDARPAEKLPGAVISPGNRVPAEQGDQLGDYPSLQTVELITSTTLRRLLTVSAIAFGIFVVVSLVMAWWLAGRVLRPVGIMAATARRLSGNTLHQRIALAGPPGELKNLADTFDAMLDRVERLVLAQQQFAANAAHELRTPMAIWRSAAEIGLADPDPEHVAWIREELLHVADKSEHLIESLLLLAVADQELTPTGVEPVRLDETVALAAADRLQETELRGITLTTVGEPVTVDGDGLLLALLVRNLLDNALRYNHDNGTVDVTVADRTLTVVNTGPPIPDAIAPQLFEPFRRLGQRTHTPKEGAGLGLSIVAAIGRAHHAQVDASANPAGGMTVTVRFSPADRRPGLSAQ